MAKIVKPNVVRGQIFDKIAEAYGNSVLGMYDGKLRMEIIDDDGNVVQFSLAPVIHKTLVEEEECDDLIPIDEQMEAYNKAIEEKEAAKAAAKEEKAKAKATKKTSTAKKVVETKATEVPTIKTVPPSKEIVLSDEEQAKIDELSVMLEGV